MIAGNSNTLMLVKSNEAIFDAIAGILHNDNTPSSAPLQEGTTLLKKIVSLEHHIFDGTCGWMVKKLRQ